MKGLGQNDVEEHPDVASRIENGWRIQKTTPRIVEGKGARCLVVLARPSAETSSLARDSVSDRPPRAKRTPNQPAAQDVSSKS